MLHLLPKAAVSHHEAAIIYDAAFVFRAMSNMAVETISLAGGNERESPHRLRQ